MRRYLDGGDPIGAPDRDARAQYAIAGVVKNSLYNAFGEPPTPMIYFSYRDRPSATGEIHLRTRAGAETDRRARRPPRRPRSRSRAAGLRRADAVDHIEANLIFRRIPARMFAVLGPLLLLLAAIGIYAVVAYAVTQRTSEIGVRLALGATPRLVGAVRGESLLIVGVGALAGWRLAFAAVFTMLSAPLDVAVFAGVPALLLTVTVAASWWPARRVARVDPMAALRQQ